MIAANYFERALKDGGPIGRQQAQVLPVEGLPTSKHVWLGTDADSSSVAYFEVDESEESNFLVSQVIRVHTVLVDESTSDRQIATVKVTCLESKLRGVFCVFIDETLSKLTDHQSAVEVITSSAEQWRRLLQVANGELAESVAKGIYGELSFLENACQQLGPSALKSWQKSPQEVHDFIGPSGRVEAKTSSFQNRAVVNVHGLRQMEPPVDAPLTLAVAEIEKHSGETLTMIVDRLLDMGLDAEELTEKLAASGYVRGMPGADEWRFEILSTRYWEITNNSPVLNRPTLPDDVADAISEVGYSLSLSALGDFEEVYDWSRLGIESS